MKIKYIRNSNNISKYYYYKKEYKSKSKYNLKYIL